MRKEAREREIYEEEKVTRRKERHRKGKHWQMSMKGGAGRTWLDGRESTGLRSRRL